MKQNYESYTDEDRQVWKILFERQMASLPGKAGREFLEGIRRVGFEADRIPDFTDVNHRLKRMTGWELTAVPGIVPNRDFFELLTARRFPATTWLRKMAQLDYLEEPDMFHDVFGHVPLLSHPRFCGFLEGLSRIALRRIDDADAIERLSRIYWYTVEFGLIREGGDLRIYGAGILSSSGETEFALCGKPEQKPYDPEAVLASPYFTDRFQDQYFVVESLGQLFGSLNRIERCLSKNEVYDW